MFGSLLGTCHIYFTVPNKESAPSFGMVKLYFTLPNLSRHLCSGWFRILLPCRKYFSVPLSILVVHTVAQIGTYIRGGEGESHPAEINFGTHSGPILIIQPYRTQHRHPLRADLEDVYHAENLFGTLLGSANIYSTVPKNQSAPYFGTVKVNIALPNI